MTTKTNLITIEEMNKALNSVRTRTSKLNGDWAEINENLRPIFETGGIDLLAEYVNPFAKKLNNDKNHEKFEGDFIKRIRAALTYATMDEDGKAQATISNIDKSKIGMKIDTPKARKVSDTSKNSAFARNLAATIEALELNTILSDDQKQTMFESLTKMESEYNNTFNKVNGTAKTEKVQIAEKALAALKTKKAA